MHPIDVWVLVEMIDSSGIEGRCPANYAVHFIAFAEQQLRQVGAILSGNTCD